MAQELVEASSSLARHKGEAAERQRELECALQREQEHLQLAVSYYEEVKSKPDARRNPASQTTPATWPPALSQQPCLLINLSTGTIKSFVVSLTSHNISVGMQMMTYL